MKRTLSIVLLITMVISMMAIMPITAETVVWDGTVATGFASGSGNGTTPETAYLISNASEFAYFRDYVNGNPSDTAGKYYKLTADIVMNKSISFTPIAAGIGAWASFKGDFDGDGHKISKVFGDTSATAGTANKVFTTGLFGCVGSTANIHNFIISDAYFSGINPVGAVAGMATLGARFSNIYVDSDVEVDNKLADGAGGIIGQLTSGKESGVRKYAEYKLSI